MAVTRDAQRSHLPIQICTLDAERLGRVADPAMMLFQDRGDVVAFEPGAGLTQRPAVREDDRSAVQPHVREHILETDAAAALQSCHDALDERAQPHPIAAPW